MDAKHQFHIKALPAIITAILGQPHRPRGTAPRTIKRSDFSQFGRRRALSKCRNRAEQQSRDEGDDSSATNSKISWRRESEQTAIPGKNLPIILGEPQR